MPGTVCPDGSAPRDLEAERRLRNLLGLDESDQDHPLEAYDIGCDEGSWNAFLRKLWCGAQAMPFAVGKWAIGIGINLMGWALEFRVADSLTPVAGAVSQVYDTSLVGPLGLRHLAWTTSLFVAGWHLLRARLARGLGEIATTFLIAVIGGIIIASPDGYLNGAVSLAKNSSGAVLEAIDETIRPGDEGGAEVVRDRLGDVLRHAFVAEPYDLVNWGGPLSGACAVARDEVLDGGPWGSDDRPREIMREHGCEDEADFNDKPSDNRAVASLAVAGAAVGTTVLLVALALVVFVAQITLVALFAGSSIVWTLALFPGGRALVWWWLSRLVWAVAATVGATFVLSWLAITTTATLAATSDLSIVQRCLVVLLLVLFAFRLRGQVGRAVESASQRIGDRFGQMPGGGGPVPRLGGSGGGGGGFGITSTARSWATDVPGGQYAYNAMYARHFRGYRGRPVRSTIRAARRVRAGGRVVRRGTGRAVVAVRTVEQRIEAPVVSVAQRVRRSNFGRSGFRRPTVASSQVRERLRTAREARARHPSESGYPIRALRDMRREARIDPARPRPPHDPDPYDWM